jgi:PelA/Pel-15E family pectate lyase
MYRCAAIVLLFGAGDLAAQAPADLRTQARAALDRAVAHHRDKVARHGGYVYYTSVDLKDRWGEGKADEHTIFVQPPGTPTIGEAYLEAFAATANRPFLDAARETAAALVYGQLQSGGWTQTIHFAKADRMGKYRNGRGGNWNNSSLDDGQTQAALVFLMKADKALGFQEPSIHEAAKYGLEAILKAQFPNGAFPQVWNKPAESKPILNAKLPDYDWKTEGRVKNYWDFYTLNDGLAGTVLDVLVAAHAIYGEDRCKAAAAKLGDFLVAAQLPDPQPGWCQQYNFDMVPVWARKFEPPAVSGWESQDAMDALIRIARFTGDAKYLEPIPKSLAYFRKSLLPDGRVARFYELKTNKPLYMDAAYRLTYDDAAAPSHYGWKQPARFDAIEKRYEAAKRKEPIAAGKRIPSQEEARTVIAALDAEGRWVSTYSGEKLVGQPKFADGFRYLSSEVFAKNLTTLATFIGDRSKD